MSASNVKQIKVHLERQLVELIEANTGAQQASAIVDLDQSRVGRLSRMDALQNQAISQSAMAQRAQHIRQTKSALRRIESGEYGLCIECEEPIDPRRLAHNPAAPMCIQCAQKAEQ